MTSTTHKNIVLIGYFNAKVGRGDDLENKSDSGKILEQFVSRNRLVIINHEPVCRGRWTRVEGEKHSEIDYVIGTKEVTNCVTEVLIDEAKEQSLFYYKKEGYDSRCIYPDHNAIIVKMKWTELQQKIKKRFNIMTTEGWRRYEQELETQQLHLQIRQTGDIFEEYTNFTDSVRNIYDKCTKRVTRNSVGNVNRTLKGIIKELKKEKRTHSLPKEKLDTINQRIKLLQEHCESEMIMKQRRQVETVVSKIKKSGKADLSEFWTLNRRMKDHKAGVRTAITDVDGRKVTEEGEIKGVYQSYYKNLLTTKIAESEVELQAEEVVEIAMRAVDLLGSSSSKMEDLTNYMEEAIKQLKKRKSSDTQTWRNEFIIYGGETMKKGTNISVSNDSQPS